MTLKNNRAPILCCFKLCASFQCHKSIQIGVTVRKRSIQVIIGNFFGPCDLEIWQMTLKNNRAPLLCCIKLCASFHSHQSIQTGVTVRKRPIRVKIDDFLSHVTLELDRWPWKTIWHLFYAASSFGHHFIAISELKLELQSGNSQFGLKSVIFFCPMWPWNLTDDLEKNRAPILCCFKLCASFYSHQSIQTGVTVRKRPIWVKIDDFFVLCDLEIWQMTLKNDVAPFLYCFKLWASFQSHG